MQGFEECNKYVGTKDKNTETFLKSLHSPLKSSPLQCKTRKIDPLQTQLELQIVKDDLLRPRDQILIACSGGPDSVALTHLIHLLAKSRKWKTALAYFHHGLRNSADQELLFVRNLARAWEIPFYTQKKSVTKFASKEKESIEEAARHLRYDFLCQTAKKHRFRVVLLAHNQDDQAETVLMRILQGTGLRGLCGIRKSLTLNRVLFYRPLLLVAKQEILRYLKDHNLRFCKDETNDSQRYLRNRIRHALLPQLKREFNPRISESLARLSENLDDDLMLIQENEDVSWKQAFASKNNQRLRLKRKVFSKFAPALQFRLINRALKEIHVKSGLDHEAWKRLRGELHRRKYRVSLPKEIQLSLEASHLEFKIID